MSEKTRLAGIVLILFLVAAFAWNRSGDTEPEQSDSSPSMILMPEQTVAPIPEFEFEADSASAIDGPPGAASRSTLLNADMGGAGISGHIFDLDSGEGIAGVGITLYFPDDAEKLNGITGPEGAYRFDELMAGSYEIVHDLVTDRLYQRDRERAQRVVLETDQRLTGVDFGLSEGLSVSGLITDDKGSPVAGVQVKHYSGASGYATTTSQDDGRYKLEHLTDGAFSIVFSAAGHKRTELEDVESGVDTANVTLPRTGMIVGQITDTISGDYVTEFSVGIVEDEAISPHPDRIVHVRDAEGMFSIRNTEGYAYPFVHVQASGYIPGGVVVKNYSAGLEVDSEVSITLSPECFVSGQVLDDLGAPIENALIYLGPVPGIGDRRTGDAKTFTDSEGRFTTIALPGGEQILSAFKSDYAPDSVQLTIGHSTPAVEFVLGPAAVLEGLVTLGGEPVARAWIGHSTLDSDNRVQQVSVQTKADGRFRMTDLPSGVYPIRASIRGRESSRFMDVVVEMTYGLRTEVIFPFAITDNFVEGTLLTGDGQPESVQVSIHIDAGDHIETRNLRPLGYYRFDSVPAGNVTVQCYEESSGLRVTRSGVLGANEPLSLDFVFDGTG